MFFTSFALVTCNSDILTRQTIRGDVSGLPTLPPARIFSCLKKSGTSNDAENVTTKPTNKKVTFPKRLHRVIRRHNFYPTRHGSLPRAYETGTVDPEDLFLPADVISELEKLARVRAWELNKSLYPRWRSTFTADYDHLFDDPGMSAASPVSIIEESMLQDDSADGPP